MRRRATFISMWVAACSLGASPSTWAGPPTFRVVSLTGDAAPGTPEGVVLLAFGAPTINASGRTAFHAFVSDGLPGVWSEGSGTLDLVARWGDPAPDAPEGVTFTAMTSGSLSIPLSDAGAVTFRARLDTFHPDVSGSNDSGIWSGGSGSLSLVAREGDQAPGAAEGANFGDFGTQFQPILSSAGESAFRSILSSFVASIWAEGAGGLEEVAIPGQPAPGTPEGVVFSGVGTVVPVLSGTGRTAVRAGLSGPGVDGSNGGGIWAGPADGLKLVARAGDQAPGLPEGVTFTAMTSGSLSIPLSDAGDVAFRALLDTSHPDVSGSNDSGIWSGGSGSLSLAAREGDQAPGAAEGINFGSFSTAVQPILNSAGKSAFRSILSSFVASIWAEGAGGLEEVAIPGQPAPGTPEGVVFAGVGTVMPVLSGTGRTAVRAGLSGPGVDGSNGGGIWAGPADGLELVARAGDQAPGLPNGVLFSFFPTDPVINDAGQTAFTSNLTGAGVNSSKDWSLFSEGSGALALLAREGNQAAGAPVGVAYVMLAAPIISSSGQTACWGLLSGPGVDSSNDRGLWSGAGSLALIAREGSQAPDTPEGVVFNVIDDPAMNAAGHAAFSASLVGPGVGSSNNRGLWAQDASGVLTLIARKGDSLEVAPGDFRTIGGGSPSLRLVGRSGGQDGRPTGLNDAGQLAVHVSFTNNSSGILVFGAEPLTPGDLDGDGEVRVPDLIILLSAWGPCPKPCTPGDPADTCPEDLDGDCEVRVPDLIILLSNWG